MSPRSFHSRHRENTTKIWRLPFFPILVSNWYRQVKTSRRKSKGHLLFRPCWTISEKRAFACSEFCLYCGNASILLGTTLGKYQASSITHSKLSSILVHAHMSSILVLVQSSYLGPNRLPVDTNDRWYWAMQDRLFSQQPEISTNLGRISEQRDKISEITTYLFHWRSVFITRLATTSKHKHNLKRDGQQGKASFLDKWQHQ